MAAATPLSALLSRALVAFTIEFDNEFEHRMSKTWARPFLTSMVMWSNVMQFAADDGTTVEEVGRLGCRPRRAGVDSRRAGAVGIPPGRPGRGQERGEELRHRPRRDGQDDRATVGDGDLGEGPVGAAHGRDRTTLDRAIRPAADRRRA